MTTGVCDYKDAPPYSLILDTISTAVRVLPLLAEKQINVCLLGSKNRYLLISLCSLQLFFTKNEPSINKPKLQCS